MKEHLVIGLLIILSSKAFSQSDNYINGYVVKESRDTVFGQLEDINEAWNCLKIRFIDSNGNKVKFKDSEVYAYKRGSELYFKKKYKRPVSLTYIVPNMKGFMKLIDTGEVQLFEFTYLVDSEKLNGDEVMRHKRDYYIEKDNRLLLVRKLGFRFRKTMTEYFSDNFELAEKIKSEELKYGDTEEIVRTYNRSKE